MERGWVFSLPLLILDESDPLPCAWIVAGGVEYGNVVGAQIVHHNQVIAGRIKAGFVDGVADGRQGDFPGVWTVGDFFHRPVIGETFVGHHVANGLHGGTVDDKTASAHAKAGDGVAVARIVQAKIQTRQRVGACTGSLAFLDEEFGHGSHLVVQFVSLCPVIVVFPVFSWGQFNESDGSALRPSFGQNLRVGDPIAPEGGKDLGFILAASPREKSHHILLTVGTGKTISIRERHSMDA